MNSSVFYSLFFLIKEVKKKNDSSLGYIGCILCSFLE